MTKAPRSKRPKNALPATPLEAALEVLERHRVKAHRQRTGPGSIKVTSPEAQEMTVADFAAVSFENLSSVPLFTSELKKIADAGGTTVEVLAIGVFALGFHKYNLPLPPALREYLTTQDMPRSVRNFFLKPYLS
jgi:hypothetical protein